MPEVKEKEKGFHLKYHDFKKLEKIIEEYNTPDGAQSVDFNNMPLDEKDILWKIKTVIRNMESVRLRPNKENETT